MRRTLRINTCYAFGIASLILLAVGTSRAQPTSIPAPSGTTGSIATAASKGLLVVVNSGEDTIAFVDLAHPDRPQKISTRKHPQDIVASPNGTVAYVAEMGTSESPGNTVAVIDLRARKIVRRFELGQATRPHLLVLGRDGRTLWAACAPQNSIVELDVRHGRIKAVWDTQQMGSYMFALTPNEKKLYVANFDAGTVSVIRRSDAYVKVLKLGGQPIGIDVSPNGREVWVSNFQSNNIGIIGVLTDKVTQTFPSDGEAPARLKFTPNGRQVLVTESSSNELVVFDANTKRVIRHISTGKFSKGLVVLPDGKHAFVSAMAQDTVASVDVENGRVLQTIATGTAPEGLVWLEGRPSVFTHGARRLKRPERVRSAAI